MNLKNKLLIYLKVNYILCVIRLMTAFNANTGVSQSVSFLTQLNLFEAATVREREFFLAQFCSIQASEQTCIFFLKQKLILVTLNLLLRKVYFFFQISYSILLLSKPPILLQCLKKVDGKFSQFLCSKRSVENPFFLHFNF